MRSKTRGGQRAVDDDPCSSIYTSAASARWLKPQVLLTSPFSADLCAAKHSGDGWRMRVLQGRERMMRQALMDDGWGGGSVKKGAKCWGCVVLCMDRLVVFNRLAWARDSGSGGLAASAKLAFSSSGLSVGTSSCKACVRACV